MSHASVAAEIDALLDEGATPVASSSSADKVPKLPQSVKKLLKASPPVVHIDNAPCYIDAHTAEPIQARVGIPAFDKKGELKAQYGAFKSHDNALRWIDAVHKSGAITAEDRDEAQLCIGTFHHKRYDGQRAPEIVPADAKESARSKSPAPSDKKKASGGKLKLAREETLSQPPETRKDLQGFSGIGELIDALGQADPADTVFRFDVVYHKPSGQFMIKRQAAPPKPVMKVLQKMGCEDLKTDPEHKPKEEQWNLLIRYTKAKAAAKKDDKAPQPEASAAPKRKKSTEPKVKKEPKPEAGDKPKAKKAKKDAAAAAPAAIVAQPVTALPPSANAVPLYVKPMALVKPTGKPSLVSIAAKKAKS